MAHCYDYYIKVALKPNVCLHDSHLNICMHADVQSQIMLKTSNICSMMFIWLCTGQFVDKA